MTSADDRITKCTFRRFDLALFVVHPTLSPAEITIEIGLQPHVEHAVGDRRITPAGGLLRGRYKDTRWRHVVRNGVHEQFFVQILETFLSRLSGCKRFFGHIKSTGGSSCLIVSFLGDGHFGDVLPAATLAEIADLHLDLGIEVYSTSQA